MTLTTGQGSAGLESAALEWTLVERSGSRESGLTASFSRARLGQRFSLRYDGGPGAGAMAATLDAGSGRVIKLVLPAGKDASDAAGWLCDCPAGGVLACLHVALTVRGLNESPGDADALPATAPEEDAPDASYVDPSLTAPAGLRAAAAASTRVIVAADDGLRVGQATVRKTPTGLRCDCPMGAAPEFPACLHRVLVDAWARGDRVSKTRPGTAAVATRATAAAPTKRPGEKLDDEDAHRFAPILARVEQVLAELVTFGLQRATAATLERIDGLVIAGRALGVRDAAPRHAGLGRLTRSLERLRQVLDEFRQRLVTTTELHVLRELGTLRSLIRAQRANLGALPLADFAGATQKEYETVAVLDLQGLGFEEWITPAGFAGVTAYLGDLRTGRVLTRTNALPKETAEQIAQSGWNSSTWSDTLSSQAAFAGNSTSFLDLGRGRFLLSGAQVAPDSGRLSGSGKTQLAKRPVVALDDPKLRAAMLVGAGDGVRIAGRLGFDPLGRPASSPPVALVPVKELSAAHFDRARQELFFTVQTPSGMSLVCSLTYRDELALWFDNLERMTRAVDPPRALFCRLRLDWHGLTLEPLTAYFAQGAPRHLTHARLEIAVKTAAVVEMPTGEPTP